MDAIARLLVSLLPVIPGLLPDGDTVRELEVEGRTRRYLVHVPAGSDATKPAPVVLVLHGAGTNGRMMPLVTGFSAKADREGFIVAYPDGTGAAGPLLVWNAGGIRGRGGFTDAGPARGSAAVPRRAPWGPGQNREDEHPRHGGGGSPPGVRKNRDRGPQRLGARSDGPPVRPRAPGRREIHRGGPRRPRLRREDRSEPSLRGRDLEWGHDVPSSRSGASRPPSGDRVGLGHHARERASKAAAARPAHPRYGRPHRTPRRTEDMERTVPQRQVARRDNRGLGRGERVRAAAGGHPAAGHSRRRNDRHAEGLSRAPCGCGCRRAGDRGRRSQLAGLAPARALATPPLPRH